MKVNTFFSGFTKLLLFQLVLLPFVTAFALGQTKEYPLTLKVMVSNTLKQSREEVMVYISKNQLLQKKPNFNPDAFIVMDKGKEIPSQFNQSDKDFNGLVLVLDKLGAGESRELSIHYNPKGKIEKNYPKRTQAEISHRVGGKFENKKYIGGVFQNVNYLRVPEEHTDHSYFIRYEGPGWESDKVAYRFYLDWRNGVDVFGKKTHDMVLQQVGQDGFDSYHNLQDWGMDVLKVGKSLGVGSLAYFDKTKAIRVDKTDSITTKITENGAVFSSINTRYFGWNVADKKHTINSRLSIHAGSRLTKHMVDASNNPDNLSTGIIKDPKAKLITNKGKGNGWGYMATYGAQSLNNDNLGCAVLFKTADVKQFTEDDQSHIVVLSPKAGKVEYYFLAAWELEPEGIKTEQQFIDYLEKTVKELSNPVKVEIR